MMIQSGSEKEIQKINVKRGNGFMRRSFHFFFLGLFLYLFLVPDTVYAAVAVDDSTSDRCTSCSTLSYPFTVGSSGVNRLLVVGVAVNGSPAPTVSSVTYNGVALTQIGTQLDSAPGYENISRIDQWRLVAPATGTHNVVVTLSSAAGALLSGATSLTGVDQGSPVRGYTADDGWSTTASVTVSSADGDLVLDTVCNGNSVGAPSQDQQYVLNNSSSYGCDNIGGSTKAGASSVVMSWGVGNDIWIHFAAAIKPAGASQMTLQNASLGRATINQ